MFPVGIGVIPPPGFLNQRHPIGTITVNLVGGHVNERRLRCMGAAGFQEVESANRVGVEIIKRNGCGPIVRRLRRRVHDKARPQFLHQLAEAGAVADIQFVVVKVGHGSLQPLLVPARVGLRPEENRSLVVIQPMDLEPPCREKNTNLRTDQPIGTGD